MLTPTLAFMPTRKEFTLTTFVLGVLFRSKVWHDGISIVVRRF